VVSAFPEDNVPSSHSVCVYNGSRNYRTFLVCSACGATHTESGKLYRKVKHRGPPKSFLTPTAKACPLRRRSRRLQGRGAPHTEHGLGVLNGKVCVLTRACAPSISRGASRRPPPVSPAVSPRPPSGSFRTPQTDAPVSARAKRLCSCTSVCVCSARRGGYPVTERYINAYYS